MPRFVSPFENPAYLEQVIFLYLKYSAFLDDDYALNGQKFLDYFFNLLHRTAFYIIVEHGIVSGFVYLDNFIGDANRFHSAELTTCFDKRFWGDYTKNCARLFLDFCYEKFGFKKIKALVYPENVRVKTLLKSAGFEKEALLKCETMRNNRLQDVEVYSKLYEKY